MSGPMLAPPLEQGDPLIAEQRVLDIEQCQADLRFRGDPRVIAHDSNAVLDNPRVSPLQERPSQVGVQIPAAQVLGHKARCAALDIEQPLHLALSPED